MGITEAAPRSLAAAAAVCAAIAELLGVLRPDTSETGRGAAEVL